MTTPYKKKTSIRHIEAEFENLAIDQDKVMTAYKKSGALKDTDQVGELHMFFSPTRVPVGLTKKEVKICLSLRRFRQIERELQTILHGPAASLLRPINLPRELLPLPSGQKMTRKKFKAGIKAYKVQVLELIDLCKQVIADNIDARIKDL